MSEERYEVFTMKEVPAEDRPREKLMKKGSSTLTDEELVAILLRTGTSDLNALDLAQYILRSSGGLSGLMQYSFEDLSKIHGVKEAKACQLLAGIELGKRAFAREAREKFSLSSPQSIADLMMTEMRYLKIEKFIALLLDTKNHLIAQEEISIGGISYSLVDPRSVFEAGLRKGANAMVLVHNHPSGNPHPSEEDKLLTKRMAEVGELLSLKILDHIIIGDQKYFSFKEHSLL